MFQKLFKRGNKIPRKITAMIERSKDLRSEIDETNFNERVEKLKENVTKENWEKYLDEVVALVQYVFKKEKDIQLYDVQILAGYYLAHGDISEMATGEGKTYASVLPVVIHALYGAQPHVITTNEYLSERDAKELAPIYNRFGFTVGINKQGLSPQDKKKLYAESIVYSTHSELVFDYLRDNLALQQQDKVNQNKREFAIIDECDSVLIDDARTPLIISGGGKQENPLDKKIFVAVKRMEKEHYTYDHKDARAVLTEEGVAYLEKYFNIENLYASNDGIYVATQAGLALKALHTLHKDKDYMVERGELLLLDPSTGRVMEGKRYSEGLHAWVERKEKLRVSLETETLGSITYQHFFRLYETLAGMTGTAKLEEEEFLNVYNMKVYTIPRHKELQREDLGDLIFLNNKAKMNYLVKTVSDLHKEGVPVLIGTPTVEESEAVAKALKKAKLKYRLLNAKQNKSESDIIANAGQLGQITIATNMAGRGTDIMISDEVRDLGGLVVISTNKHVSRRIDQQLIGRSGRQGDPGKSMFLLSLDDELLTRFVPENVYNRVQMLPLDPEQPLSLKFLSRAVGQAQLQQEGQFSDARQNMLKFDTPLNMIRLPVYEMRDELLSAVNIDIHNTLKTTISKYVADNEGKPEVDSDLRAALPPIRTGERKSEYLERIVNKRIEELGDLYAQEVYKLVKIQVLDQLWQSFMSESQTVRDSMHLQSYAQEDPINAWNRVLNEMFHELMRALDIETMIQVYTMPKPQFELGGEAVANH